MPNPKTLSHLTVRRGCDLKARQDGVGGDYFAIIANAEMLKRSLDLSAPQLVRGHFNDAQAIAFRSRLGYVISHGFNRN